MQKTAPDYPPCFFDPPYEVCTVTSPRARCSPPARPGTANESCLARLSSRGLHCDLPPRARCSSPCEARDCQRILPCEAFVARFALPASTEGNCSKTAKQSSLPEWRRKRRANRAENAAGGFDDSPGPAGEGTLGSRGDTSRPGERGFESPSRWVGPLSHVLFCVQTRNCFTFERIVIKWKN